MEIKQVIVDTMMADNYSVRYVLYEYTFAHSDFIEDERDEYKCLVKQCRYVVNTQDKAVRHFRDKHQFRCDKCGVFLKTLRGIEHHYSRSHDYEKKPTFVLTKHMDRENILSQFFMKSAKTKWKDTNISLNKYRLWCHSRRHGRVVEVLLDSREKAYELMKCTSITQLLEKVDKSEEGLQQDMLEFEDRIKKVYDNYLGTPKERTGYEECERL